MAPDAGADTMRDIATESYEVHYTTHIIFLPFFFNSFRFTTIASKRFSILDCFPFRSLSLLRFPSVGRRHKTIASPLGTVLVSISHIFGCGAL